MAAALLLPAVCAYAQTSTTGTYGSFSPYSIYGVGEISKGGTAHSRSMGGVGIASRNRRFINVSNPAAVAVRDTLAFMADFGLYEDNKIYAQGSKRGAENTFNVNNIVMSFPIWRSSAFLVGLSPFSDVGYSFSSKEQSDELLGHVGNITFISCTPLQERLSGNAFRSAPSSFIISASLTEIPTKLLKIRLTGQ